MNDASHAADASNPTPPPIDPCPTPGCRSTQVVVKLGVPPHFGKQECAACGRFRKWVSRAETPGYLVAQMEVVAAGRSSAMAAKPARPTLFD